MDYIKNLIEKYSLYKTTSDYDENFSELTIFNPYGNSDINVIHEIIDISFERLTFYFCDHHRHFDIIPPHNPETAFEELCEYIDGFLSDKLAVIEFFKDEMTIFGRPISLENTSDEFLENIKSQIYFPIESEIEFKIRCWHGKYDTAGKVINGPNGLEVINN